AGDAYTELWRSYAMRTGQRKIQTFGISEDADVKGTFLATPFGSALEIDFSDSKLKIQLNAAGQHNVLNALAAAACCQSIGISHDAIRRGLENFRPVNGRLQRKLAANGVTVIDDTYNANPDSVRAAIDVLAQLSGRRTLILGDMGEVGDSGEEFHREIGEYARSQGIEQLLLLGELVRHTAIGFGVSAQYFHDIDSLFLALDSGTKSQSTVLVKGSRFMRMERVVAHLLASGNTTLQQ
ncbi:MAG: UDP-N-acetylmuramoyl-tripeptide--D-alanyl-D-alanine ligase, partial [Burkholderiales bacterium]|nr:UDP-N-acetylmuramoyl-tripeptide--D-alanyl-D-alanine ligase [Burkholderiales bacterium]